MNYPLTITIESLSKFDSLKDRSALSDEDHYNSLLLATMQAQVEGLAIVTDGLFGKTRSGQSTTTIEAVVLNDRIAHKQFMSYLQSQVRYNQYPESPESLDRDEANDIHNNRTRNHRQDVNYQRNQERIELKCMILKAYANGDLGKPRSQKAIATRDRLLARVPKELPYVTAGRELFKLLSIWGLTSYPQYGPPERAIDDTPERPDGALMDYVKSIHV